MIHDLKIGDKVKIVMPDIWAGIIGVIKDINGVGDDTYYHVFWNEDTRQAWLHYINIEPFNASEKVIFN